MISKRVLSLSPYKTETTSAKVKLSSNELSIDFPEEVKKRIAEEVSKIPFNRYPDPEANLLKEALAGWLGVKPENLLLGNGSDELIYYLSIGIGEFDRGVFYPVPTFSMYGISAQVLGREKVETRLDENFDVDLKESLRLIEESRPIIAYFAYPNNPTGNCFSEDRIRRIREKGLFLVVDEAYYSYSGKTFLNEALHREDTVVLRTLSKIGMAGLRVGIMVGREEVIRELNKIRLPFNITYPSQVIAKLLLTEFYHIIEDAVRVVIKERGILRRISAILYHRKVGFTANAMTVWKVKEDMIEEVGRYLASFKSVSHCYERSGWDYNLFAMLHGKEEEEVKDLVRGISQEIGLKDYALLFSTREFKKRRISYFSEDFYRWYERMA